VRVLIAVEEIVSQVPMLCVPDEHVRVAGVYEALHFGHRPPHQVFLFQHEIFPRCRQCGSNVIFKLVRAAIRPTCDHISADKDFATGVSAA
jgi:hypothetical protein